MTESVFRCEEDDLIFILTLGSAKDYYAHPLKHMLRAAISCSAGQFKVLELPAYRLYWRDDAVLLECTPRYGAWVARTVPIEGSNLWKFYFHFKGEEPFGDHPFRFCIVRAQLDEEVKRLRDKVEAAECQLELAETLLYG